MCKLWSSLVLLVALLSMMVSPAYATIYVWKDANGVNNATDDPRNIPSGVRVQTLSYDAVTPSNKETSASVNESETWVPTAEAKTSDHVSQGEFAVLLAAELGLGDGLSPQAAAEVLSADALIAPRLGKWDLDAPMTQGLLDRLGNLTLAAARAERIPIGPDEARFAFDSATALAGISGHFAEAPTYVNPPVVRERIIVVEDHPFAHIDPHLIIHVGHGHRHVIHKYGHGLGFKHAVHPKRHRRHAKTHVGSKHKRKLSIERNTARACLALIGAGPRSPIDVRTFALQTARQVCDAPPPGARFQIAQSRLDNVESVYDAVAVSVCGPFTVVAWGEDSGAR